MKGRLAKHAVIFIVVMFFCIPVLTSDVFSYYGSLPVGPSVNAGISWLISQQDPNTGYWQDGWGNIAATTGLAIVKLSEYAFETGYTSPFDPNYVYHQHVEDALDFLFTTANIIDIDPNIFPQPAGNPDVNADGNGVFFVFDGKHKVYETGIAMMAIASTRSPARIVTSSASPVNGWTYKEVLQNTVDYMAFAQTDLGIPQRGGWGYEDNMDWSDNSNSGYAVLGLAYAESPLYGFNCIIPQFVRDELNYWIDFIQVSDGGSGYNWPDYSNGLRTGNLIFQMIFYGDTPAISRVQDALWYLGWIWDYPSTEPGWKGPPPHYQAMYCIMKGLEFAGINTIDVFDGSVWGPREWYTDFAIQILSTQQADGSWPADQWGDSTLATLWALLTLETSSPPEARIKGQCIHEGESFVDIDLDASIDPSFPGTPPYTWSVSEGVNITAQIDPNTNVMSLSYTPGFTGAETLTVTSTDNAGVEISDHPTFIVCSIDQFAPVVLDIPDQFFPFAPFDLDDYLDPNCGLTPEQIKWVHSPLPDYWHVDIDQNNVVTINLPGPIGFDEAMTVTFAAISRVCPCDPLTDSDDATFMIENICLSDDLGDLDIGNAFGQIGNIVTFPVRIQSAPNMVEAFGFDLLYDPFMLEFVDFTPGPCITGLAGFIFDVSDALAPGRLRIGGFNADPNEGGIIPAGSSCDLVYLNFLVKDCEYPGAASTLFMINLVDDFSDWFTSEGCFYCSGNGDINHDGRITPGDALCAFQKYLEICPTDCGDCLGVCCDVNADGNCFPSDALCIFMRYLGKPSCLDYLEWFNLIDGVVPNPPAP